MTIRRTRSLALVTLGAVLAMGYALGLDSPASGQAAVVQDPAGIDPATAEAIAVVERFSTAIAAGRIDQAATNLAPELIVLESGGIEQSREEYLGGHAAADAEFLEGATVTLRHRRAQASGDLAWVASESRIEAAKGAEPMRIDSTETMVLRRSEDGWKIVHIHWSSRVAGETSSMQAIPEIVVHKSPSCGCCEKWVDHLRAEGFLVKVIDTNEIGAFKQSLKVPAEHASCHTAVVDGYFIEGHVPGPDIRKLLAGKPAARGLAVPGMPAGSPGMEVPSGQVDVYETLLIDNEGRASVFARHGGN